MREPDDAERFGQLTTQAPLVPHRNTARKPCLRFGERLREADKVFLFQPNRRGFQDISAMLLCPLDFRKRKFIEDAVFGEKSGIIENVPFASLEALRQSQFAFCAYVIAVGDVSMQRNDRKD